MSTETLIPSADLTGVGAMPDDPLVNSVLFTVAYELLGSAADAEDIVQEAWLRWADVDRDQVRDPWTHLVVIVTRQALERLRTDFAESGSDSTLSALETLAPVERAVFVLREVFDLPYDDIAAAVDRPPAVARQIAYSAREHVAARMQADPAEPQDMVDRFVPALRI